MILAIDPGPLKSAWVVYDPATKIIDAKCISVNEEAIGMCETWGEIGLPVAIEMVASYGMAVGASVFDTCVWIGRFEQAATHSTNVAKVYRKEVKIHLCGSLRAKDANIRQALLDRFPATGGGRTPQIGTKAKPGPLYGVKSHIWSALAVAVTYAEAPGN